MKILANTKALSNALALAGSVVLSRSPKPVLMCVKLTAAKHTLTVTATNMELSATVTISEVDVSTEGVCVVPAAKLAEIVNSSPDDTLTIEADKDAVRIKGSDASYKIHTYSADEYPPVGNFDGAAMLTMPARQLHEAIQQTAFAAAREMTRYAINGVLFERSGKGLQIVATDGHRLAWVKASVADGEACSGVLPIKAVGLLQRILADADDVRIAIDANKFHATTGNASISCTLVEGTFPPYADVVPKDCDKVATLDRERFASAVRRASLLTNEESKGVRLAFDKSTLAISGRAAESGEAKIEMPADYSGDAIEIGFNPTYILDAMKVLDAETVRVELKSPTKPMKITAGGLTYVVMPVNLN